MNYDYGVSIDSGHRLSLAPYNHYNNDLQSLIHSIQVKGRKTILWNHARGFILNYLTEGFNVLNTYNSSHLFSKPGEALRFIINRPQKGVDYILEDFHHFIGDKESIHPNVGEVRALVKELSREYMKREQTIFFFVPSSYQLPPEMIPFFKCVPQAVDNNNSETHALPQPSKDTNTDIGTEANTKPDKSDKPKSKEYLNKYGVLLNDEAVIKRLKPLIGSELYIERIIQILSQMETNNPLLVGYPGVGKTAIVEGFARALYNGQVTDILKDKMLYSISLNSLIAGTKFRGEFENRLEGLMNEVRQYRDQIIIFIDEIHSILHAGSAEGSMSAGDILKPVLARGEFPCIGATTFSDSEIISTDPALSRRFKKVFIHEPSPEEALIILKGVAVCFEKFHHVKFEEIALMAAIDESMEWIKDEYLPGKAIALLDSAAAYCKMKGSSCVTEDDILIEIEKLIQS